ncbi:MAG: hypothetical protein K0Q52_2069 [Microbacterium sp.]|nr:hypothetical protein [Microbacterium sp.]
MKGKIGLVVGLGVGYVLGTRAGRERYWTGVVKVAKSMSGQGTPGQRLDSAIATGREAAEDLAEATEEAVEAAKATTAKAAKPASKSTAAKPAATKAAPKNPGA